MIDAQIEAYFATLEPAKATKLKEYCDFARSILGEVDEKMSYGMPTFYKKKNIVHFAAFKNHIGMYPGGLVEVFAEDLKQYKWSKGAIQFPYDIELPKNLIEKILKYCLQKSA